MGFLRKFLRRLGLGLRPLTPRKQDFVIDTGSGKPRDLDDPFSDPKAQARVAEVIAQEAAKNAQPR